MHFKLFLFLFYLFAVASLSAHEESSQKTFVDPHVIQEYVKKYFAFTDTADPKVLSLGVNDMYLIETGSEKYVLRLSRADKNLTLTDESFLFELAWLEFLNSRQIPVSYPIRRVDQQLCGVIQAPEGPRYATLFSYADGSTDLSTVQAFILGKSLAQLHEASDDFTTDLQRQHLDCEQLIDGSVQQIKVFLGLTSGKKLEILDQLKEKLCQQILRVEKTKRTFGIIAGDVHGYNQHFTQNNQLTMFDFEFCAYGYRVYDLATFRWGRGADKPELWNAFLDGYQSIRNLTKSELESIDGFIQARTLWWIASLSKLPDYCYLFDEDFWESIFSEFETRLAS